MGIGQITLADRFWQFQQHFERWAFRVELEQSPFEFERQHRLLLRLPFEPDGNVHGRFTVHERERDLFPFRLHYTGRIKVVINAASNMVIYQAKGVTDNTCAQVESLGVLFHRKELNQ